MNVLGAIIGLLMIGFSFAAFIYAIPSLDNITQTGSGTRWENSSATTISAMNFFNQFTLIFPAMMLIGGLFISIKSLGV